MFAFQLSYEIDYFLLNYLNFKDQNGYTSTLTRFMKLQRLKFKLIICIAGPWFRKKLFDFYNPEIRTSIFLLIFK